MKNQWNFQIGLLVFFLASITSSFGQYSWKNGKSFLEIGLKTRPKRAFKNQDSSYSGSDLWLKFNIPVWRKLARPQEDCFRFSTLILSTSHILTAGNVSFLERKLSQIHSNLGFTILTTSGPKNTWIISLSANAFADTRYFSGTVVRPTGLVMYNRQATSRFSYRAGAGYSFLLGSGIPLPVIGFSLKSGERGRFNVTLPYRITYSIRHSGHYQSVIFMRPEGSIGMVYTNLGIDSLSARSLFIRNRAFSLGYLGSQKLKQWGQIQFAVGLLFRRKLSLTDPDFQAVEKPATLVSGNLKGGLFLELKWRIPLGGKKKETPASEGDPVTPTLDDVDLNNLDITDLDIQ